MKKGNYQWGIFYYDKNDPRLFIDQNLNFSRAAAINGQIVNFAHRKKFVRILGLFLLACVIVFMTIR